MRYFLIGMAFLLPFPAFAECNVFKHEANDKVVVTLADQTVTLDNNGDVKTMIRAITKPYGQLVEVAVEGTEPNAPEHFFEFLKFGKVEKLVFDSQVFVKACKK